MTRYPNFQTTQDIAVTSTILDRLYSTGEYWDSVTQGNQKRLLLSNPSDSDVVLLVVAPTVRANGQVKVDKTKNVTIDTDGDAPSTSIVNKSTDNGGATATAQLGGDNETGVFSGGTSFNPKTTGSGNSAPSTSPGTIGELGISNLIHPGDNLVLGATAVNADRTISLDIDFIEYPEEKT